MGIRASEVRIGGASAFWGDSSVGPVQLIESGEVDYLVFDYLAELTMSIMANAKIKDPQAGYAKDFVSVALKSILPAALNQGVRMVSNAGGINPRACAQAIRELAQSLGLSVKVAVVEGDDLMPQLNRLQSAGITNMQTGATMPSKIVTANAYLGAQPIKAALDAGADIVVTGRCVDSAVTLGILMHEYQWSVNDYDLLASGSLAGHIIECGCQATGGLHTDWEMVPDWANIGYPILHCRPDGSFVVTKPTGTGGLINCASVGEQLLYEIANPGAYHLPDVIADFRYVSLVQLAPNQVEVKGAIGYQPTDLYKVSATYLEGYRCNAQLVIIGADAEKKLFRTGEAILERTRSLFKRAGLSDYSRTYLDVIGRATAMGAARLPHQLQEGMLWLAVTHDDKRALDIFAKEISAAGTSWSPGTTGGGSGRPSVSPSIRQFPCLVPKDWVSVQVTLDEQAIAFTMITPTVQTDINTSLEHGYSLQEPAADWLEVPLIKLAYARSGDKGDIENIGIIARDKAYLPWLNAQLTEQTVAEFLQHYVKGKVTKYQLPGIGAFNFVCEQALDGGGMASLRFDPLGKAFGQILLTLSVKAPPHVVQALGVV